MFLPHDYTRRL